MHKQQEGLPWFTWTLMVRGWCIFGPIMEAVSKTFYTSPQSRSYPCLVRVVPYGFMVYLDPGARCMVYLQPQQRMVPSKSPLQISIQNVIFLFTSLYSKKALLSHFLGRQRGYPRMISFFVPPSKVFPRPNILARL